MAGEAKRHYNRDAHRRTCLGLNGELPCLCWCGRKIMHVAPSAIRAGRTESCGRDGCVDNVRSRKAVA